MDAAAIELPEATLISEVSDEALEAAANTRTITDWNIRRHSSSSIC
jgi:hypothetical protein